jgi:8-oxo-dGTP pyrophosphatase MutT (NUDIX family)
MGNKIFCSDEKTVAKNSNTSAMMDVHPQDESATHGNSSSIPPDCPVDHPLQLFQRLAKERKLPVFDDEETSIDFQSHDYRAFCLLIHPTHGAILLHCTRKKKKPPHYQLPGGHVDQEEFEAVLKGNKATCCTPQQLFLASRAACAREIYEETSIDLRDSKNIDRLLPLILHNATDKKSQLCNEFKDRLFFVAQVSDDDFSSSYPMGSVRYQSLPQGGTCNLMLQLSVEHSGFKFATSVRDIVESLQLHSGGKVSKAVTKAYNME